MTETGRRDEGLIDLLIVSQVYPPDPASVGQHMHDVAQGMRERGHDVAVVASGRGYSDPSQKYPHRDRVGGIDIRRVRFGSFGKRTLFHRVLGGAFFLIGAAWAVLRRRPRCVLVSTSPPFAPSVALLCRLVRVPCVVWVMDLNPAQAVALGRLRPRSAAVRAFHMLNRKSFRSASRVVVMDSAMLERIQHDYGPLDRTEIVPPWPHVSPETRKSTGESRFRAANEWTQKFVVMYSGNHSPANPLKTILDAAETLAVSDPDVHFAFVGGGREKKRVEARKLSNVSSLPYQPFEQLEDALGAADLHVVTMGDAMLGIVHPCKIYGAMAVGRPVLGIAPEGSHIQRILWSSNAGWWVRHGAVDECVSVIQSCQQLNDEARAALGREAQKALRRRFSMATLRSQICDVLEGLIQGKSA